MTTSFEERIARQLAKEDYHKHSLNTGVAKLYSKAEFLERIEKYADDQWQAYINSAKEKIAGMDCPDEGCPHYGTPHAHPECFAGLGKECRRLTHREGLHKCEECNACFMGNVKIHQGIDFDVHDNKTRWQKPDATFNDGYRGFTIEQTWLNEASRITSKMMKTIQGVINKRKKL